MRERARRGPRHPRGHPSWWTLVACASGGCGPVCKLLGGAGTIALLGDADFLRGPFCSWEGGLDRQGLNKEASGVGGAANHLLPPLGPGVRAMRRLPGCAPSAMHPSLQGLSPNHRRAPLAGHSFFILNEQEAEAAPCEAGRRMEKDSWPHLLQPQPLWLPRYQRFRWGLCCSQEYQALEPHLPQHSHLAQRGRDTSQDFNEVASGWMQGT